MFWFIYLFHPGQAAGVSETGAGAKTSCALVCWFSAGLFVLTPKMGFVWFPVGFRLPQRGNQGVAFVVYCFQYIPLLAFGFRAGPKMVASQSCFLGLQGKYLKTFAMNRGAPKSNSSSVGLPMKKPSKKRDLLF